AERGMTALALNDRDAAGGAVRFAGAPRPEQHRDRYPLWCLVLPWPGLSAQPSTTPTFCLIPTRSSRRAPLAPTDRCPHPQTGSLAADDAPLSPYVVAVLIRNSYSAGLAHADALRRLTEAGEVDPTNPWTLLRGALENSANCMCLQGLRP
ncbi:hypothetical protein StrepF001_40845, partial [Streptomyces sp. F001]